MEYKNLYAAIAACVDHWMWCETMITGFARLWLDLQLIPASVPLFFEMIFPFINFISDFRHFF